MSGTAPFEIESIKAEIAELREALADASDGGQQTRLRRMIEARRRQLKHMRRRAPGADA